MILSAPLISFNMSNRMSGNSMSTVGTPLGDPDPPEVSYMLLEAGGSDYLNDEAGDSILLEG